MQISSNNTRLQTDVMCLSTATQENWTPSLTTSRFKVTRFVFKKLEFGSWASCVLTLVFLSLPFRKPLQHMPWRKRTSFGAGSRSARLHPLRRKLTLASSPGTSFLGPIMRSTHSAQVSTCPILTSACCTGEEGTGGLKYRKEVFELQEGSLSCSFALTFPCNNIYVVQVLNYATILLIVLYSTALLL